MSDTFDTGFLDFERGSAGPRSTFIEGVTSGFNQSFRVDAELSLQQEVLNRWNENLALLEQRTAQRFDAMTVQQMRYYIERRAGNEDAPLVSFGDNGSLFRSREENVARTAALPDATVSAINQQSELFAAQGLPSFDEIFEEVVALQQKTEAEAASVSERGGAGVFVGQLLGGIAGSFTTRDPTILASILIPTGASRSVAVRIASEAAAAGTTEAFLQYNQVARNRELAGLRERDPTLSILMAAGGAAVLRGVFEAGGAGVRSLRERAGPDLEDLSFEDAQLRQFLGEQPQSPSIRAAQEALDDEAAVAAASPYGTSYQGLRRFTAEVAEAEMALLGRSDTAISRVLPDLPRETLEREADFAIVRELSPEVAARADAAKERVVAIEDEIAGITAQVQSRTVIDAVRFVDEDAARQLETLAARTDIPDEARALEADIIFNRVGKERILKAAEDAEIEPKKQTQRLRQQRKAAAKQLRTAMREMEAERAKLTQAANRVKAMLNDETTDLLGYAIATRPPQGSKLATERVIAQREAIAKDGADAPERAIAEIAEDGTVDVGLPTRLAADFLVPNEAGELVPVSRIVEDFNEDARLVDAMGSCAI